MGEAARLVWLYFTVWGKARSELSKEDRKRLALIGQSLMWAGFVMILVGLAME